MQSRRTLGLVFSKEDVHYYDDLHCYHMYPSTSSGNFESVTLPEEATVNIAHDFVDKLTLPA